MKKFSRIPFLISIFAAIFVLAACGPAPAGVEVSLNPDNQTADVEFMGTVENMGDGQWIISGQVVMVNAQTQIENGIVLGSQVQVRATVRATGEVAANRIRAFVQTREQDSSQSGALEFTGIVETIAANTWVVSGQIFSLDAQTEIKGNILLGDTVKVEYMTNSDGSFSAIQIAPAEALAVQSENTFEVQFQNQNGQPFELFGTVEAIDADTWTVSGQTFAVNTQTEITGTIFVGDFVKVHLFDDNGTLTASEIRLADPQEQTWEAYLEFTGTVESLGIDSLVVDGQTFFITSQTEIKGIVAIGDKVKVEAALGADGSLTALEVKKFDGTANVSNGGSSSSISSSNSQGNSSSASVGSSSNHENDDHGGSSSSSSSESEDEHDDDHGGSSSSSSSDD